MSLSGLKKELKVNTKDEKLQYYISKKHTENFKSISTRRHSVAN